jgi:hypothetical protein
VELRRRSELNPILDTSFNGAMEEIMVRFGEVTTAAVHNMLIDPAKEG